MNGLLSGGQQGVAPEVDYRGEPNATPEEQAQYEKFVDNGLLLISSEQTAPQVLSAVKQGETPANGLATATVAVVRQLKQSASASGQEISPDVILHGGLEIMNAIATMAEAAGVHSFTEQELESALYIAMDEYGTYEVAEGGVNRDALAQDMQLLQSADQEGRLDDLFGPGFTEQAQRLGQQQGG